MSWLVLAVGPLQALVNLCGLLVFRRINISGEDMVQVRRALQEKRERRDLDRDA